MRVFWTVIAGFAAMHALPVAAQDVPAPQGEVAAPAPVELLEQAA